MSLKKTTAKSGFWSISAALITKFGTLVVYAVLARFLSIEEFGSVGLTILLVELMSIVIGMGIKENLIKSEVWCDRKVNTAFCFLISMSVLIGIFILLLGLYVIPLVYDSKLLASIFIAFCAYPLINSINVIQLAKLQREFQYKKLAFRSAITTVASGVVGVVLAVYGFGAWSIVISRYVQVLLNTIILWKITNYRPSLELDKSELSSIVSFGYPLVLNGFLTFFNLRLVDIFVSIFLGPVWFALLDVGKKSIRSIYQISLTPLNNVSLSFMSRSEDKSKAYIEYVSTISLLMFPLIILVGYFSRELIWLVFGEKWLDSAIILQITSLGVIATCISWFMQSYMVSISQTMHVLYFQIFEVVFLLIAVIIFLPLGLNWIVAVNMIVITIATVVKLLLFKKMFDFDLGYFAKKMLLPLGVLSICIIILVLDYAFGPKVDLSSDSYLSVVFTVLIKTTIFMLSFIAALALIDSSKLAKVKKLVWPK
ncbi:MAG: oligosaccharide flippase family protein [Acidiferrobacterales bacterium]|nr:oligosaccharide flippase family protein [Acidiferrobacterales bacterium]